MVALQQQQQGKGLPLPTGKPPFKLTNNDLPCTNPSSAPILPRRILFHPAFRTSCAPTSSLGLHPLNALPIDPPRSRDGDQAVRMQPEQQQQQQCGQPPESLESLPVQRIGGGLANMGNTCFLNSVLQCLTYTPPLAAYLQSGQHRRTCQVSGFCAMCALEVHVKQALSSSGRIVSPTHLVKNLRCISRSFHVWRQEDAHEYMRYLIEALQKCCRPGEVSGGSSLVLQKSFIHKIFGGRLRSQVKCTQCSHCSNTYDPFLDLSLDIVRAESLVKALARFTALEVLDGDNKYQCSRCKTKVRALKQFTVDKTPQILTIQFKRFSSSGGLGGKIDKKVHFDRTLDMKPFANGGEEEGLKYTLYAVLVHSGWSTHSGHYYCFVRTATDMWHVLDDSRVSQVSEKTVLEQKAYILFYIREAKTPGSIHLETGSFGKVPATSLMVNGSVKMNGTPQMNETPKIILTPQMNEPLQINGTLQMNGTAEMNGTPKTILTPQMNEPPQINGTPQMNGTAEMNGTLQTNRTAEMNGTPKAILTTQINGTLQMNGTTEMNGHSSLGTSKMKDSPLGTLKMNGTRTKCDRRHKCLRPSNRLRLLLPHAKWHFLMVWSLQRERARHRRAQRLVGLGNSSQTSGDCNGKLTYAWSIAGLKGNARKRMPLIHKAADPKSQVAGVASDHLPVSEIKNEENGGASSVSNVTAPAASSQPYGAAVPRWNEVEGCEADEREAHNLFDEAGAHCGHVLDEWDEEYDRGKRKKVRSKTVEQQTFSEGNPDHGNLFQAMAGRRLHVVNHPQKRLKKWRPALGHRLASTH